MRKITTLMNEFCSVLIQVERNGITIDIDALDALESDYKKEYNTLKEKLNGLAEIALGDTPFSLSSNDDLSMLIFSRKPKVKKKWAEVFNLGTEMIDGVRKAKRPIKMSKFIFNSNIKEYANIQYKTKAYQCMSCNGSGMKCKKLQSGVLSKVKRKCLYCNGVGIQYEDLNNIAGFKQLPRNVDDLAAHGYKCNKNKLIELAKDAEGDAKIFLSSMVRFNAISHYLSSFIKGIRENVGRDGVLHTQFMQCVTATGRLSSRNPNFHNQPRGGTFPIRQVVVSRWGEGRIVEADYAQLEFRIASALAKDDTAIQDIIDGVDVHQRTADILTRAGQLTSRQDYTKCLGRTKVHGDWFMEQLK